MKNLLLIILTILICTSFSGKTFKRRIAKRKRYKNWLDAAENWFLKQKKIKFTSKSFISDRFRALVKAEHNQVKLAIKLISNSGELSSSEKDQASNESEKVQRFKGSKFLIPFCDVGTVEANENKETSDFIIFPQAKHDLRTEVNCKPALKQSEKVKTVIQMALAVKEIHDRGIIHRDIKPDNFLRMRDGRVLLTDFEFAVEISQNEEFTSKEALGTFFYIPFDKREGEYKISKKTDMFALGITIGELIIPEFKDFFHKTATNFRKNKNDQFTTLPHQNSQFFKILENFYQHLKSKKREISEEQKKIEELLFNEMLVPDEKPRILSDAVLKEIQAIYPLLAEEVNKEYSESMPNYCKGEESKVKTSFMISEENKSSGFCQLI